MQLLQQGAGLLGVELSNHQLALFDLYQSELLKWNTKINLISEKTAGEIVTRHFLDSLTAAKCITPCLESPRSLHAVPTPPLGDTGGNSFLKQTGSPAARDGDDHFRMVDVGCGAGFPGIPLKIALPSIQLYLLETNRKKVSFLKHIIRLLHLEDTFTLHDRTENIVLTDTWKEKFDVVLSRASLKLPDLLSLGTYFLVPEGLLITLKGSSVSEELSMALTRGNHNILYQIFQYDINLTLLGPPRKIIIAQKAK